MLHRIPMACAPRFKVICNFSKCSHIHRENVSVFCDKAVIWDIRSILWQSCDMGIYAVVCDQAVIWGGVYAVFCDKAVIWGLANSEPVPVFTMIQSSEVIYWGLLTIHKYISTTTRCPVQGMRDDSTVHACFCLITNKCALPWQN